MPKMAPESRSSKSPVTVVVVIAVCAVAAAVGVTMLLFMPVRQEVTIVGQPETPAEAAEESTATALTIEQEAAAVAGLIPDSGDDVAAHITSIEVTTVLRRPVIVVATDIGPEQASTADEFTSVLSSFIGGLITNGGASYTYYLQIHSSEGDLIGAIDAADDRWTLDTPVAPADPATLRSWLDTVYGSGAPLPEAWSDHITAIAESVDADGNIVVRTDLDPASPDDRQAAQTIIDAVNSSGATFAPGIRVVFGNGTFEWAALLDGVDPYGP